MPCSERGRNNSPRGTVWYVVIRTFSPPFAVLLQTASAAAPITVLSHKHFTCKTHSHLFMYRRTLSHHQYTFHRFLQSLSLTLLSSYYFLFILLFLSQLQLHCSHSSSFFSYFSIPSHFLFHSSHLITPPHSSHRPLHPLLSFTTSSPPLHPLLSFTTSSPPLHPLLSSTTSSPPLHPPLSSTPIPRRRRMG